MPAPLSLDLRTRIVAAHHAGEGSQRALAARFAVGHTSVARYLARDKAGDLAPTPGKRGRKPLLDDAALALLAQLVAEHPDDFDHELAERLCERTGVAVSARTINRALHALKLTRKKSRSAPRSKTPRGSSDSARSSRGGSTTGRSTRRRGGSSS
jgi:transposase